MPYDTVREEVVQTRRVRVCARCRNPIPEAANRQTMNTVGSLGGSLTASLGASIAVGSLLGPVGAIGGALVGSVVGARAGREASNKVAEAVESQQDSMCPACRKITDDYNSGGRTTGGGGDPRPKIGEAASAAGRGLSNGLGWMKQSVTNIVENAKKTDNNSSSSMPGRGHTLGSGKPIS